MKKLQVILQSDVTRIESLRVLVGVWKLLATSSVVQSLLSQTQKTMDQKPHHGTVV